MTPLGRVYRWLFFHHRCSFCGQPRPAWMAGDHTTCIEVALGRMLREEVEEIRRQSQPCEECGLIGTHRGTCSHSAMLNPNHPYHRRGRM